MEHKPENRTCQNCKLNFTIEPDDFSFYEKIKVPPPTFCPECRLINRLNNISERTLYKDSCDNCGKDTISLFSPTREVVVFCNDCWWSDSWNPLSYGKEYDFSKPFFEQLDELRKVVPCQATNIQNSTDCKYCNGIIRCKNCTFVFSGMQCINCYYCLTPIFTKDSLDADFVINADHVYEILNSGDLYNTKFTYFSDECIDSSFLFNCLGCSKCFGCINLRNQKYCIWNKQYSKKDYEEEILKYNLGSYSIIEKAKIKFAELYYKIPRKFALISNSIDVSGDDIQNSKSCKNCFSATHGVQNCKYIFHGGLLLKDSYDMTLGGDTSELLYEATGAIRCQNTFFTRSSNNTIDSEYCENVYGGTNLFGCAKLRHKKYCILNKQYTKEEYEELIPRIKKHMNDMPYIDKEGRVYKYGDFYPKEHSMWTYNESWAHQWFPLTKDQALEKGFIWSDSTERDYTITMKSVDLPDHIDNVEDSILDEVIECEHNGGDCNQQCTTAYKILPDELILYRSMKIALPHLCPNCRHYERLKKTNPLKLETRKCMCGGIESENKEYRNTVEHAHGSEPCQNNFETAISEDRKEIVYCEKCYQAEFI
ncbi:MAG: hypothetical protein WCW54_00395 [Candidatus Paceibacterota bacterium]